nr:immunoglobulin heavy chain junction region [Mus musculus]
CARCSIYREAMDYW